MSHLNTNDNGPLPSDHVTSISGDLLEDVHIDFGQEEEEEDSVFDHNLMQYLDQLPIAAPPADAKYSASFVDSVLNGIDTFKHLNNDTDEPFISSLLDYSQFEEAYSSGEKVADQAFSVAVEQPRGYDDQQEQLYQEQEEIPIQFNMHQDDQSSVMQPALSVYHSTDYSGYPDLIHLGQDQPNDEAFEDRFLTQRKAELDALFDMNENTFKDYSSWFYYPDDDASQIHPKNDMAHPTTNALNHKTFSTEYPIESKYEAKDPFSTTEIPFEKHHLTSKTQPQASVDFTTNYAYDDVSHQGVNGFLQTRGAIAAEKLTPAGPDPLSIHDTNDHYKPSAATPTSHAKTTLQRRARPSSSVNISKADFMSVSSTSSSKRGMNESKDSFAKYIAGTSTPVKKNSKRNLGKKQKSSSMQHVGSSKQGVTVLKEVDKNAPSTGNSSHRYSMRTRTSPGVIRKTYSTPNKPMKSRTFNFSSSKRQ